MIENWWKAHEFEFLMSAIGIGAILLWAAGYFGWIVVRDVLRKRRKLDKAYREEMARVDAALTEVERKSREAKP